MLNFDIGLTSPELTLSVPALYHIGLDSTVTQLVVGNIKKGMLNIRLDAVVSANMGKDKWSETIKFIICTRGVADILLDARKYSMRPKLAKDNAFVICETPVNSGSANKKGLVTAAVAIHGELKHVSDDPLVLITHRTFRNSNRALAIRDLQLSIYHSEDNARGFPT